VVPTPTQVPTISVEASIGQRDPTLSQAATPTPTPTVKRTPTQQPTSMREHDGASAKRSRLIALRGVAEREALRGRAVIEAVVNGAVEHVTFILEGPERATHVEYGRPYTLFGGVNGKPYGWDTTIWPDGDYQLYVFTCNHGQCESILRRFSVDNTLPPSATPAPVLEDERPWEALKPALTNPKTVYLTDENPTYVGNGDEDVVIVAPRPLTRPVRIGNVRHLVMIGAELRIARPMPNPLPPHSNDCEGWEKLHRLARQHTALVLFNVAGVAYIEGLYINGVNGNITEGIQTYDTTGRNPQARFYVINSRLEGAWTHDGPHKEPREVWPANMPNCAGGLAGRPKFNKPDLLEGMYGSYSLWNVTARGSAFQGIYFTPEHGNSLGDVQLRNVNVADVYRQGFAIHKSGRSAGPPVWTLSENTWLHHRPDYTYSRGAAFPYMYFDKPDQLTGSATNGQARWSRTTDVVKAGLVMQRGDPPQGDFAPANKVGQRYDPVYFVGIAREGKPPSVAPTPPWEQLKPVLNNPKTVYLSNENPIYHGSGDEDVLVVVKEALTKPAAIRNVRNFVLIGGEFGIAKPFPEADWPGEAPGNNELVMQHKALSFVNIRGIGYAEGIYVNGTNGNLAEGIQIWGASTGRIILVNSRIEDVRTTAADRERHNPEAHADLIQLMSGGLVLHNVTLVGSEFQGLFMKAEHGNRLGDVYLRNVNVRDVARQPLWPYHFADGGMLREASNVFVEEAHRTGADGGYLPRLGRTLTTYAITWRGNPAIADGVTFTRGNPPDGDFAPADSVGRDYDPHFFNN
jgi:hypothetical protein